MPGELAPIVAVVARSGEAARLHSLAIELARFASIVALAEHSGPVDAILASSPEALRDQAPSWTGPAAVVCETGSPNGAAVMVVHASPAAATLGVADTAAVATTAAIATTPRQATTVAALGEATALTITLPAGSHPVSQSAAAIPLWTRERWRERLAKPPTIVIAKGCGLTTPPRSATGSAAEPDMEVEELSQDTALAQLSWVNVAVLQAEQLAMAVATATPCVCTDPIADPALAALVVSETDPHSALVQALHLAEPRAGAACSARLLQHGRAQRPGPAAVALLAALGLHHDESLGDRLRRRCEEVELPPDSPLALRIAQLTAGFDASPPSPPTVPHPPIEESKAMPTARRSLGATASRRLPPALVTVARTAKAKGRRIAAATLDRVASRVSDAVGDEVVTLQRELHRLEDELGELRHTTSVEIALLQAERGGAAPATRDAPPPPGDGPASPKQA